MNSPRLYLRYIGVSLKSQMQYRASFAMLTMSSFLNAATEFIGIWALFDRFKTLRGWTLAEVAMFYAVMTVAMAIGDAFGRGFDIFDRMVRSGDFDRLLLRPRSTALQIAAQELTLFRLGKFSQGFVVLMWSAFSLGIDWQLWRIGIVAFAIVGGASLFYGLFVLQATLAFWSVESLEVMNAFTYGGLETAQYPLSIYKPWFRRFFTLVVPLACVSYFPLAIVLDKSPAAIGFSRYLRCAAPLAGIVFMLISLQVWKFGVRHYRSTGS